MDSFQLFDWRKEVDMSNWVNRFGHILSTGLFADVSFYVGSGKEVIEGHKLFLMTGSRVFQELLNGKIDTIDIDETVIEISEVEPKEFKQLLKYLYTGDKGYKNDVDFDPMAFLKTLKYFEVEELYKETIQDLVKQISFQNALQIYEESKNLKMNQLTEASEIFIMENGTEIIKEPAFLKISSENLQYFLASDSFEAQEEIQICMAVLDWGEAECLRQKLEGTEENLWEILKDVIPLIRFPLMNPRDFSILIKFYQKILEPEQIIGIFQYFHLPLASQQEQERRQSIEELGFITHPRTKMTHISTPIRFINY